MIALLDRSHAGLSEQLSDDEVTGCLNRRALFDRLDPLFALARG